MFKFIEHINFIGVLVIVTYFYGLVALNKEKRNFWFFFILNVNFLTEILSAVILSISIEITLLYSISFILHQSIWLILLDKIFEINKKTKILIILFYCFCLLNILFLEKLNLNYNTFIFGSIIYLILFLNECIIILNSENLIFFKSNPFLLISAPVLFFIGFSFVFGFRNSEIRNLILFKNIDLYTFISYSVNIIYYTLINIYIYRERKLKNA